ncbi:unnamed protein product, partial [Prorocentrum cordatum]
VQGEPVNVAINVLVQGGLADTFSRITSSSKISTVGWFRSMALTSAAAKLTAADSKPNQEQAINEFTDDVYKTIEIIHPAFIAHAGDCNDSMAHFASILVASRGCDRVTSSEIGQAIDYIENQKHTVKIKDAFHFTTAGSAATASCQHQLAVTAKDDLGDKKIDRALEILNDFASFPTLLRSLEELPSEPTMLEVGNFIVAKTGEAFSAIDESTDHLFEATKLWDKRRCEEQAPKVAEYMDAAIFALSDIDCIAAAFLSAVFAKGGLDVLLRAVGVQSLPAGIILPDYEKMSQTVQKYSLNNHGLQITCERLMKIVGQFPHGSEEAPATNANTYLGHITSIVKNVQSRSNIKDMVERMGAARALRESGPALDEWLLKQLTGDENSTFLQSALEVANASDSIENSSMRKIWPDGSPSALCVAKFPDQPDFEDISASLQLAFGLPRMVKSLPLASHMSAVLGGALETSVDKFMGAVRISDTTVEVAFGSTPDWWKDIGSFCSPSFLQYASETVGNAAASDEYRWECDGARTALRNISEVIDVPKIKYQYQRDGADPPLVQMLAKQYLPNPRRDSGGANFATTVFEENGFKKDITSCIEFCREYITGGTGRMNALEDHRGADIGSARPRTSILLNYFHGPNCATDATCKALFDSLLDSTVAEGKELQKATPMIDDTVNDTRFNRNMARTHLHNHQSKDAFGEKPVKVHRMLSAVGYWHRAWGIQPPMQDEVTTKESIDLINTIYTKARKALTVIAALNVIFSLMGKVNCEQASFVLDSKRPDIPESMMADLRK